MNGDYNEWCRQVREVLGSFPANERELESFLDWYYALHCGNKKRREPAVAAKSFKSQAQRGLDSPHRRVLRGVNPEEE